MVKGFSLELKGVLLVSLFPFFPGGLLSHTMFWRNRENWTGRVPFSCEGISIAESIVFVTEPTPLEVNVPPLEIGWVQAQGGKAAALGELGAVCDQHMGIFQFKKVGHQPFPSIAAPEPICPVKAFLIPKAAGDEAHVRIGRFIEFEVTV